MEATFYRWHVRFQTKEVQYTGHKRCTAYPVSNTKFETEEKAQEMMDKFIHTVLAIEPEWELMNKFIVGYAPLNWTNKNPMFA